MGWPLADVKTDRRLIVHEGPSSGGVGLGNGFGGGGRLVATSLALLRVMCDWRIGRHWLSAEADGATGRRERRGMAPGSDQCRSPCTLLLPVWGACAPADGWTDAARLAPVDVAQPRCTVYCRCHGKGQVARCRCCLPWCGAPEGCRAELSSICPLLPVRAPHCAHRCSGEPLFAPPWKTDHSTARAVGRPVITYAHRIRHCEVTTPVAQHCWVAASSRVMFGTVWCDGVEVGAGLVLWDPWLRCVLSPAPAATLPVRLTQAMGHSMRMQSSFGFWAAQPVGTLSNRGLQEGT